MYIIGINPTSVTAAVDLPQGKGFGLGDLGTDGSGNTFVYVQANGAITGAGYACVIDETFQAAMLSTSNDDFGDKVGIPRAAFADNDYGWLQIYGVSTVLVAATVSANTLLMTTSTAGQLEDTATGVSVDGVVLTTANGGGGAAATACVLNWPTVGATVT